ncbi:MAG: FtsL-like putative cell division protein, partial [Flavobacteriales bacterium]|nr:FtsL-like putative cell division protein [Flavobacteriales bacterium]
MTKPTWKKLINVLRSRMNELYVDRLAPENLLVTSWRLVLFISVLAVLVVYSSHKVDQKVIRINKLKVELKKTIHHDVTNKFSGASLST